MLKSSRKKLIAIGCSFTEHYLNSIQTPDFDYNFPRWPQHLADKLDMECVNLGQCAAGNKYILSKIVDTVLTEKNIGLVVVMWSQFQRLDFQYSSTRWRHINIDADQIKIDSLPVWRPAHRTGDININTDQIRYKQKNLKELHNPHSATQDALRTFILAEKLLKDIPHLYIQGPSAVNHYNTETLLVEVNYHNNSKCDAGKSFLNSPYFDYVEENLSDKFIGWPIFLEIGGYDVDDILDKLDPERNKLRVSSEDTHPNREGHKIIAQEIYNAYEKVYL